MSTFPIIPESAPFDSAQRSWLNGFFAGLLRHPTPVIAGHHDSSDSPLLVLFGSQSGNAESFAKVAVKRANANGFKARSADLDSVTPTDLVKDGQVLIITSTWGEGEMPDNAQAFWTLLNQNGASPKLSGLKYSLLALGDRNYADTFCQAGRLMDERITELGGESIHPRVECDVDYESPAEQWLSAVLAAFKSEDTLGAPVMAADSGPRIVEEVTTGYSKKNPFQARLVENRFLNNRGSAKDTRHIAFDLVGSDMEYEAGDALGVYVKNCPGVVDSIIAARGFSAQTRVAFPDGSMGPLREALIAHYEIRQLLCQPSDGSDAATFVAGLKKLQPRLYSISSSPKAHPEEVHLTVGTVRYENDGVQHKGVASTFLADRLAAGETTGVFVHRSPHFRPPADKTLPMIMVGPGTGIAPFRAFLEERQATGSIGKNWLFFGDQRSATDFLYQDQVESWVKSGHLTRLSLAFSRDQAEKVYVQTRMMEAANELWCWLELGAYFYVCGDALRMAKDVDATLYRIVETCGGKSGEEAIEYVTHLKKSKRYARDVY